MHLVILSESKDPAPCVHPIRGYEVFSPELLALAGADFLVKMPVSSGGLRPL
jgi:hypothetical protein